MKKLFATLLIGASMLTASAQTEFRHISYDEALAAAKQENKLVFIDFFTTWCGPCKMMTAKTFPQTEVGEFMNAKFIPLKLDAEKEGAQLAKTYGVRAYPTYVILNPEGKEVAKVSGYMDGEKFIEEVSAAIDPDQQPERIKARYMAGERTPKLVNAYAMQLMKARDEEGGFKVVDSYFDSLSDAERLKPENAFLFTVYTVDLDNNRARFMVSHRNDFPEETRGKINETLAKLYNNRLNTYFSGYIFREGQYNAAEFAELKSMLKTLGLENETSPVVYEFIEKRPGMTDRQYFDYINTNFDRLDSSFQDLLILNLPRLCAPSTPDIKADMSKFLRSHLSHLSPIGIQMAGRTLQGIEQQ